MRACSQGSTRTLNQLNSFRTGGMPHARASHTFTKLLLLLFVLLLSLLLSLLALSL
jgi:hypothetical protein